MRLIGFCGLAGSGKSTAAQILVEHYGFARQRFADPLKAMLRALGLSEREIDGDLKEKPCARLMGKTPRDAMQSLGTEWGRALIADDLWVELWRKSVQYHLSIGGKIVVDDVRFPNEVAAIRAIGGKIIRVRRDMRSESLGAHASETQALDVDAAIFNEGLDKRVLAARLAGALERLGEHV